MTLEHGAGVVSARTSTPPAKADGPPGALAGRAIAVSPADLDRVLEHIYRAGLALKVNLGASCVPEVMDDLDEAIRGLQRLALSALAPIREPTDLLVRLEYLTWDTARLASQGRSNLDEVAHLLHHARVTLQEALLGEGSVGADARPSGDGSRRSVRL